MRTAHEIVLSHGERNDATAFPFWGIAVTAFSGRTSGAMLLAGPWFNREDAELFLRTKSYRFPRKAYVYCFSGHDSRHFREVFDIAKATARPTFENGGGI